MRHRDIQDPDIHEPKAFATLPAPSAGYVYVTDGLGSGTLQPLSSAAEKTAVASLGIIDATTTLIPGEYDASVLVLTGTPGGTPAVITPNTMGPLFVNNQLGVAVTVKTLAGTGISIADTKTACVYSDGTNTLRLTADV